MIQGKAWRFARTGIHHHGRDFVRRNISPHGTDDGHSIHMLTDVREHFANFDARLAFLLKRKWDCMATPLIPAAAAHRILPILVWDQGVDM